MKRSNRWLMGLALAVTLAFAPAGSTAATYYWESGRTITVEPTMNMIPNTDVYYQRNAPGYDLYRYANRWYLVDNGVWYRARSWEGPFVTIHYTSVPEDLAMLPQNYRRYWDAEFGSSAPVGSYASPRTFAKKPKMARITSTGVQYARSMPDIDLYRYRSTWYLVDDGVWYRSDSWKGPFLSTRADRIPTEVLSVPSSYRMHWTGVTASIPAQGYYWASGTTFDLQPDMTLIPNSSVYYLPDETAGYGLYRYGNSWYLIDNGTWYFSNTWRGPYARVTSGSVPTTVLRVPVMYRREWYVPGD